MIKSQIKYWIILIGFGDFMVAVAGLVIGYLIRFKFSVYFIWLSWLPGFTVDGGQSLNAYFRLIIFGSTLLCATYFFNGLYDSKNVFRFRFSVLKIVRGIGLWLALYLGLSLVLKFEPSISRLYAIGSALSVFTLTSAWRFAVLLLIRSTGGVSRFSKKVAFLGWSAAVGRLAKELQDDRDHGYLFVGYISDGVNDSIQNPPPEMVNLGEVSQLKQILRSQAIDVLIRADSVVDVDELIHICNTCDREMVGFKMIPTKFHRMITGLHVETIVDVPVLGVAEGPLEHPLNRMIKRLTDIVGAVVGLTVSFPLLIVFGFLVYRESPGPVFYRQTRVGRRGKTFEIFKIRSMRLDAESHSGAQWAKKDDCRRLRIGAVMRETNIDEVPQFWNVLIGDMSLVGPRPERPELISKFQDEIPHYNARHTIKPGITGWAQVNGWRGDTDLTERIRYDLYYIEKWTMFGDFNIMFRTFFNRKNAY